MPSSAIASRAACSSSARDRMPSGLAALVLTRQQADTALEILDQALAGVYPAPTPFRPYCGSALGSLS